MILCVRRRSTQTLAPASASPRSPPGETDCRSAAMTDAMSLTTMHGRDRRGHGAVWGPEGPPVGTDSCRWRRDDRLGRPAGGDRARHVPRHRRRSTRKAPMQPPRLVRAAPFRGRRRRAALLDAPSQPRATRRRGPGRPTLMGVQTIGYEMKRLPWGPGHQWLHNLRQPRRDPKK